MKQNLPIKTDNEILQDTIEFLDGILEGKYSWLNYHCISEYLSKCKKRIVLPHEAGLSTAYFMLSNGCEDWEIHNFRRSVWDYRDQKYLPEYDEKKTQKQVESTHRYIEKGGKPPTCRNLLTTFKQDKNICQGCTRRGEVSKTTFKSVDYIKQLTKNTLFKTIETSTQSDTIWRYDPEQGYWLEDGIPHIETKLKEELGDKLKPRHLNEVIRITKVYTYCKPEKFLDDPFTLPLSNGELELLTGKIIPFNPDHNHRNHIEIKYNEKTDCPLIKKFITEIAPGDETTIQELFGYLLWKGYPIQKCFIFQGSGANGKSTLLRLMESFIGKENVSSVSLFDLVTKTFSKAELYNKLANITPDIGSDELKRTGLFKALTGGDTITAERKNQHPFQFTNYAKMIFSCNKLPTSPDNSDAFFRRFMIFQFKQIFDDKAADKKLIDKLTTPEELTGLLNYALIGYKRLMENTYFTESRSTEETKILYLEMSDPINSFLNIMVEEDPEATILKDDLYRYYHEYCINKGFIPEENNVFFRKLKGRIETRDIQIQKQRALKGIRVILAKSGGDTRDTRDTLTPNINLDEYIGEENNKFDSKHPVYPVHPVPQVAPSPFEKLAKVVEVVSHEKGVSTDFVASRVGVPEEEAEKLLIAAERDHVVFHDQNGLWRFSS